MDIKMQKSKTQLMTTTGITSLAALAAGMAPANAQGMWDGVWGGLSYSAFSGDAPHERAAGDPSEYGLEGSAAGYFIGRDVTTIGNFNVGVEAAWTNMVLGNNTDESDNDNAYAIDSMWDLKLRAGTNVGPAMLYGFAGVTRGDGRSYDESGYDFSGTNFGLGAEFGFAQSGFVGVEVISRSLNGYGGDEEQGTKTSHNAASLRVGFKF